MIGTAKNPSSGPYPMELQKSRKLFVLTVQLSHAGREEVF
jgi:hypothetical protein